MAIPHRSRTNSIQKTAIGRLRATRIAEEEIAADGRQLPFLLLRFGFPVPVIERVAAAGTGLDLPRPLREALQARLARENRRLGRLGRAGSAAYEFNRHVAVRDAMRWLLGAGLSRPTGSPHRPASSASRAGRRPGPARTAS